MQEQENDYLDEKPMSEEEIDETLNESFPASDSPSWSLGTNHGTKKSKAGNDPKNSEPQIPKSIEGGNNS